MPAPCNVMSHSAPSIVTSGQDGRPIYAGVKPYQTAPLTASGCAGCTGFSLIPVYNAGRCYYGRRND
jgi:hypothetical protein